MARINYYAMCKYFYIQQNNVFTLCVIIYTLAAKWLTQNPIVKCWWNIYR